MTHARYGIPLKNAARGWTGDVDMPACLPACILYIQYNTLLYSAHVLGNNKHSIAVGVGRASLVWFGLVWFGSRSLVLIENLLQRSMF